MADEGGTDQSSESATGTGTAPAGEALSFPRLGPACGVFYALLAFLASNPITTSPIAPTKPADAIARQFVEDRARVSGSIILTLFSLFLLLVFVSWLHSFFREVVPRRDRWVTTLLLAGGILVVATMSIVVLLALGRTALEDYGADVVIARTLLVLQSQAVVVVFVPAAAYVGGAAYLVYACRVLPRWLAFSGIVIAFGLLIPPLGLFPFILSTLWTGSLGAVLLQRSRLG